MRLMSTTIVIALLAAACTSTTSGSEATTTTTDTSVTASTTQPVVDTSTTRPAEVVEESTTMPVQVPPQIADYDVQLVPVGDRMMLLAIADSPGLRSQGLKGVTDLGDLDGMLFFWRHDGDAFWMKDTLIPLDIVWFNEDGTYKGRASMVPCTEDPCPTYEPDDLDFRFAIEAPPGALDWVDESTVITYSD